MISDFGIVISELLIDKAGKDKSEIENPKSDIKNSYLKLTFWPSMLI